MNEREEPKFEKVVEYNNDFNAGGFAFSVLVFFIIIFSVHLLNMYPELDSTFFPIGWIVISVVLTLIITFIAQRINANVYWRKIK